MLTGDAVRSQRLGAGSGERGGIPAMNCFGELTHRWSRLPLARLGNELASPLANGLDGVACRCLQRRQRNVCCMFHVGPLLSDQGCGDVEADPPTAPPPPRPPPRRPAPPGILPHPPPYPQPHPA